MFQNGSFENCHTPRSAVRRVAVARAEQRAAVVAEVAVDRVAILEVAATRRSPTPHVLDLCALERSLFVSWFVFSAR
jgi:hypothetical protein